MTVELNITEACSASHGCFLLLLCPELLLKKQSILPLLLFGLNAVQVLKEIWPDSTSVQQVQFADFGHHFDAKVY